MRKPTCIRRRSPRCCRRQAFGEMDVMDDDNAWTYWSRSDAHAMVMNIGGNPKARAGLCRVIERWIAHLLGVAVKVETVASIEDRDWRWFIGLDSEGTRIGNALWNGAAPEAMPPSASSP